MLSALGSSPEDVKWSVSAEREGAPVGVRRAPPVPAEFWQPRLRRPKLPHGQAPPVPSPRQKATKVHSAPRARANTSVFAFVSPVTRFVAWLSNTTSVPSEEIEHGPLLWSLWSAPEEMLSRVTAPPWRFLTKTSCCAFVSPRTTFV